MTEGEYWKIPVVLRGRRTTGNPHRPRASARGTLSLARERDKRSLCGDFSLRQPPLENDKMGHSFIKLLAVFAGRHSSGRLINRSLLPPSCLARNRAGEKIAERESFFTQGVASGPIRMRLSSIA